MKKPAAEQFVGNLYHFVLGRNAAEQELGRWASALSEGRATPENVLREFFTCEEYQRKNRVRWRFPAGHFHSPIVDPHLVGDYVARERRNRIEDLLPIRLSPEGMLAIWKKNLSFVKQTPFTDDKDPRHRYYYLGGPFGYGDGITLRMMINHLRPRRIVEIGSGFSSACMLDSVEHVGLTDFHLTCVEPYPQRLRALLRAGDTERVTLVEKPIQQVDVAIVDGLQINDILFIDSTHVLKTGSDVHYELFHLLPRLRPGVVVHFHDVQFPFEYPDQWIFDENRSWNEIYALRAFLMYNDVFEVMFWNPALALFHREVIMQDFPTFLRNAGGSIWLYKVK